MMVPVPNAINNLDQRSSFRLCSAASVISGRVTRRTWGAVIRFLAGSVSNNEGIGALDGAGLDVTAVNSCSVGLNSLIWSNRSYHWSPLARASKAAAFAARSVRLVINVERAARN